MVAKVICSMPTFKFVAWRITVTVRRLCETAAVPFKPSAIESVFQFAQRGLENY